MKNYRRLPLKGAGNCRDLGGYPCEGGITRFHRLYRSDSLHLLTGQDWNLLEEAGVRTILDLRSDSERSFQPDQAEANGFHFVAVPLQSQDIDLKNLKALAADEAFLKSMTEGYLDMVKGNPEQVAKALNALADGLREGAVLFHCTAGKDRTGILSALVLSFCGVADPDIVADYQVTATYLLQSKNKKFPPEALPFLSSGPEKMEHLLEGFHRIGVEELLYDSGLKKESVCLIREAMIEG